MQLFPWFDEADGGAGLLNENHHYLRRIAYSLLLWGLIFMGFHSFFMIPMLSVASIN